MALPAHCRGRDGLWRLDTAAYPLLLPKSLWSPGSVLSVHGLPVVEEGLDLDKASVLAML